MRRIRVVRLGLCVVFWLLVMIAAAPVPGRSQAKGAPIRGVWMTSNDMGTLRNRGKLQSALAELSQLNFNTIYPVVWNGGYAYYPSAVTQRYQIQSFTFKGLDGQDIIADLLAQAHTRGLLVIPWFEFGFMAPPGSELATQHPAWLTQKRDGGKTSISAAGEVVWLNPFHPEVQAFITELVLEIVTKYNVDGIQFDDHMSLPSEFGYDQYTTALYKKETKKMVPANAQDPAWIKWRADKISNFMKTLKQSITQVKPKAILSVSPNYYDFAYKLQLQDWLGWVRQDIADEIIVQLYRPNLESFVTQLSRPEILESNGKVSTGIGIMSGQRNAAVPMSLIQAQAQAAQERGLGVTFFYFESLWEKTTEPASTRKSGFQFLFPTAAPRRVP